MSSSFCKEKDYKHFGRCLFIDGGAVTVIASLDFGIRILGLCPSGGENLFYEQEKGADYLCTKEGWRVHGGHRLAFAPESEKTYWPDNAPVRYSILEDGVRLEQEKDGFLNVEKTVELQFTDGGLTVDHIIRNAGDAAITGAPWAITEVAPGGAMTMPWKSPPDFTAVPERFVSLWNTTSLADKRVTFTENAVEIRQLPLEDYFKVGFFSFDGVVHYQNKGYIFTKSAQTMTGAAYPDNGVNVEIFACKYMMELETLGPLSALEPGASCKHREKWRIK
jgi:hypothetical protein